MPLLDAFRASQDSQKRTVSSKSRQVQGSSCIRDLAQVITP